jgi:hypothetical protein
MARADSNFRRNANFFPTPTEALLPRPSTRALPVLLPGSLLPPPRKTPQNRSTSATKKERAKQAEFEQVLSMTRRALPKTKFAREKEEGGFS